jgi:hypothetical protein
VSHLVLARLAARDEAEASMVAIRETRGRVRKVIAEGEVDAEEISTLARRLRFRDLTEIAEDALPPGRYEALREAYLAEVTRPEDEEAFVVRVLREMELGSRVVEESIARRLAAYATGFPFAVGVDPRLCRVVDLGGAGARFYVLLEEPD